MRKTKAELRELINNAVDSDQQYGNKMVDMAGCWRDAINDKLDRMKRPELLAFYDEAVEEGIDMDEEEEE